MSTDAIFHLSSVKDSATSTDFTDFYMQLINHSQWKSPRMFFSGSHIEIPQCKSPLICRPFKVRKDFLDIDRMSYSNYRYAFDRSVALPEKFTGSVIRIYKEDVHVGYATLIDEKSNNELLLSDLHTLDEEEKRHGPAVTKIYSRYLSKVRYTLSNPEIDIPIFQKLNTGSFDNVLAVHCPYWPAEARKWIDRRRMHGFPSKDVILKILSYGCDFVQVSHDKLSIENNNDWRYSFSKAELFIIKSWTISQTIVYSTLWVINKKISRENLSTYYFKTLMFWACEEKPSEFWGDDLLNHSVCELLIYMMACLRSRICYNYFFPGNNMMDNRIENDLYCEIESIWKSVQGNQFLINIINKFRFELLSAAQPYYIEAPAWINRAFVIFDRVNNNHDNYTDLFSTDLTSNLRNSLRVELSNIYAALRFQRQKPRCFTNMSEEVAYFSKVESHLLLAVNLCKSHETSIEHCNYAFVYLMMFNFLRQSTRAPRIEASNDNVKDGNVNLQLEPQHGPKSNGEREQPLPQCEQRSSQILQSKESSSNDRCKNKNEKRPFLTNTCDKCDKCKEDIITIHTATEVNPSIIVHFESLKEWPGRSPTVNIGWFIAKAYLANLYYTSQCDVSQIIRTCDDIIDVYQYSYLNHQFAERAFPVVLSTQWTSIYDKGIQNLLGFYSLCSYVDDPMSRAVYLGVCPVQFAHYLKLRTQIRAGSFITEYIRDYQQHLENCRCDKRVNNAVLALSKILLQPYLSVLPCDLEAL